MDDPAENAPLVLEWEPRLDVVGDDGANRVAPGLESMGGGAARGGDSAFWYAPLRDMRNRPLWREAIAQKGRNLPHAVRTIPHAKIASLPAAM